MGPGFGCAAPPLGLSGSARARHVVIESPDYATGLACYRSPEFKRALAHRTQSAISDIIVINEMKNKKATG